MDNISDLPKQVVANLLVITAVQERWRDTSRSLDDNKPACFWSEARRKIEKAGEKRAYPGERSPVARDKDTLVGRVAVTISKLARLPPRASPVFRRKCCPFPRGHQFLEHARCTATFTRKFRAALSQLTCPQEPVRRISILATRGHPFSLVLTYFSNICFITKCQ